MIIKNVCFCEIDWSNFCIEKKEKPKQQQQQQQNSLARTHACNRWQKQKLSSVGKPLQTYTRLSIYFADDRFTCLIWIVFFSSLQRCPYHTFTQHTLFSLVHFFPFFLSLCPILTLPSIRRLFVFLSFLLARLPGCHNFFEFIVGIGTSLLFSYTFHFFCCFFSFDRCAFISFSCSFTIRAKVSRVQNEISPPRKYHEPASQPTSQLTNITYISSAQLSSA